MSLLTGWSLLRQHSRYVLLVLVGIISATQSFENCCMNNVSKALLSIRAILVNIFLLLKHNLSQALNFAVF